MVKPRVEAEMQFFQPSEAAAEVAIREQTARRFTPQSAARIPRRRVADATKAAWARKEMRFQHRRNRVAQSEIGMADNGSGDPRLDRRICGNAVGHAFKKLGFANRL